MRTMLAGLVVLLLPFPAMAVPLTVTNASFETLPAGGLPFCNGSGTGCYSIAPIPGWTNGGTSGQFQPLTAQLNYIPDGTTVAYTNGGTIAQTIAATAVAGRTYTLTADLGFRKDVPDPGFVNLMIGTVIVTATGVPSPSSGNWATYMARYTALASDAGSAIGIVLGSPGAQGDFDNVRLSVTAAVPELAAWSLMVAGFGLTGAALRRRAATVAA